MLEKFIKSAVVKSYKSTCLDVVDLGHESNITKYLLNRSVVLDRQNLKYHEIALPMFRANCMKSSLKYALAETYWYASKRLDTELIAKFGPIWKKMEDAEGLINSNYGYQIFNNQDYLEKLEELIETNQTTFFIASQENQFSRSDLVCNNAVRVVLSKDQTNLHIEVRARSIDLMYGYPYDVFAAQVFGSIVIRDLLESKKLDLEPSFSHVRFDIENVHIYNKDLDQLDRVQLEMLDDESMIVYDLKKEVIDRLRSEDYSKSDLSVVEDFRDSEFENHSVTKLSQSKDHGYSDFLIYLAETYRDIEKSISRHVEVEDQLRERIREIIGRLDEDRYDRKNLIVKDNVLIYVHLLNDEDKYKQYEVSIYG